MLTLKESMELGGRCLLNWLDPEHDNMVTGGWLVSHDTGRWWDAILRLESTTGFVIPAEAEGAMLLNLQTLTDNPDGLLLIPPHLDYAEPKFELHSLREGLLAFNALLRYRKSSWAKQRGHRMLETLNQTLKPDGRWDLERFKYFQYARADKPDENAGEVGGDMTGSSGRFLEALVWFYEATGDGLALELAERIAQYHLAHTLNSDGSIRNEIVDESNIGHNHSYHGTLRGLLLYGFLTRQHDYVDAVLKTYRTGFPDYVIQESGWAPHDLGKKRFPNEQGDPAADPASAGDHTQLALWFGLNAGCVDLLDDVERLVRARLLPAQAIDADRPTIIRGIMDYKKVDEESARLQSDKMVGGWSIHGPVHGGKGCILDVLAAVVHTLTDVYNNITTRTTTGLTINLHFDYDDETVSIKSERTETAALTVQLKVKDNVLIRIPGWTDKTNLRLTIDGRQTSPKIIDHYVYVPKDVSAEEIVLQYALPTRRTTETTPTGRTYQFAWRADEIIGLHPNEEYLPFYPDL